MVQLSRRLHRWHQRPSEKPWQFMLAIQTLKQASQLHSHGAQGCSASVQPVYGRLLMCHDAKRQLCAGPERGHGTATSVAQQMQPRRTGLSLECDDGDSVWVPQLTGKLWSPTACEPSMI